MGNDSTGCREGSGRVLTISRLPIESTNEHFSVDLTVSYECKNDSNKMRCDEDSSKYQVRVSQDQAERDWPSPPLPLKYQPRLRDAIALDATRRLCRDLP